MPVPLHRTISEKLREQILSGEFQPSEQLPSEHQLISLFQVSRITIRRAIANLVDQGLVEVYQGKGAFVKEQRRVTYSLSSPLVFFEEDMARQGVFSSIHNIVFESVIAPAAVQSALQLPDQDPIVCFQRKLLLVDQVPVAVDSSYILPDLGKALAIDLQQHMTFPILENNGIPIERIEATIALNPADYSTSEYLDVPLGNPLLLYSYKAYTTHQTPILCGEALSRGDRLCYSAVLTKQHFLS